MTLRPRASISVPTAASFVIAIDDVTHKPFSEAQFNQFAQQILNTVQRVTARRRRPHDRSMAALLMEEIPVDLWKQLEARVAQDVEVLERGTAPPRDVIVRLLRAYARVGIEPIESLWGRGCPDRLLELRSERDQPAEGPRGRRSSE